MLSDGEMFATFIFDTLWAFIRFSAVAEAGALAYVAVAAPAMINNFIIVFMRVP